MFRSRVVALALLVALLSPVVLLVTPPVTAAPPRQGDDGAAIDLAWIALRPGDIATPGYFRDFADFQGVEAAAALASVEGPERDRLMAAMIVAGWRDAYIARNRLMREENADLPKQTSSSSFQRYANEAGAAEGLGLFIDQFGGLQAAELADVGDEAVVFRTAGETLPAGATEVVPFSALRLLFRSGTIVSNLYVIDYGEELLVADVMALGEVLLGRIEAARAGHAPGLSLAVWRFPLQQISRLGSAYQRVDGETIPQTNPRAVTEAPIGEDAERLGVLDRFSYGVTGFNGAISHEVQIDRFEDEAAAAAWFAEAPAASPYFQRGADYLNFEEVIEVDAPGDEATIFAFDVAGTNRRGYLLRMQAGDRGLVLSGEGEDGLALDAFMAVATPQAACFEAGICADEELVGESIVAPTVSPTQVLGGGSETYVSPTYGFSISYDPTDWTVSEGPATEGNVDYIGFSVFGTDVLFGGFPYAGDALSCVADLIEGYAQEPDVVSSAPLLEGGVPVTGGNASDGFQAVVLTRTDEDLSTFEQAYYVRCIELIPGAAMVGIQQWSAAVFYDVAAKQREELVVGLVLP